VKLLLVKKLVNRLRVSSFLPLLVAFVMLAVVVLQSQIALAATLSTASVTLSDPRISTPTVTYDFQASNVTTSAIKCIRVEFDTAADGSGGKPTGMNITALAFSGTSDYVPTPASWAPTNNDTTGVSTIIFATGEVPASAAGRNVVMTGITNGSAVNTSYFMLVSTYNNVDCATTPVDNVTVGYIYTAGQTVTVNVDGSLSFSVAGVTGNGVLAVNGATITNTLATTATTIPFGTVTAITNKIAAQDISVSTNSGNGYTVYTRYTAKPTSGSNTIDDHTGSNGTPTTFSAAGTEAFGYTTEDATLSGSAARFTSSGGNKWAAFTTTNAELIFSAAAVSAQTTRVGFQAGIASTTEPGSYTTTVIYTAVPVY
jgi:hypothetical protein